MERLQGAASADNDNAAGWRLRASLTWPLTEDGLKEFAFRCAVIGKMSARRQGSWKHIVARRGHLQRALKCAVRAADELRIIRGVEAAIVGPAQTEADPVVAALQRELEDHRKRFGIVRGGTSGPRRKPEVIARQLFVRTLWALWQERWGQRIADPDVRKEQEQTARRVIAQAAVLVGLDAGDVTAVARRLVAVYSDALPPGVRSSYPTT